MFQTISNFFQNFHFGTGDTFFWVSAIAGTTLFVLRMLMSFIGGAFSADDIDMDAFESYDDDHYHGGSSFKLFTLHSLSGFLMMFGFAGLAGRYQLGLSSSYAVLLALLCGVCMIFLTAFIMKGALFLEGPGAVFSSKKTIGLIGIVYQRIPASGQGKINIVVDNITRELLAQSHDKIAIESFTLIKVVAAIDQDIVEVIVLKEGSS